MSKLPKTGLARSIPEVIDRRDRPGGYCVVIGPNCLALDPVTATPAMRAVCRLVFAPPVRDPVTGGALVHDWAGDFYVADVEHLKTRVAEHFTDFGLSRIELLDAIDLRKGARCSQP